MSEKTSTRGFWLPLFALLVSVVVLVLVLDAFVGNPPAETAIQVQAVAGEGTIVLGDRRQLNAVAGQNLLPGVELHTASGGRVALFWAGFDVRLDENTRVTLNNDHIELASGQLYVSNRDRRITRRRVVIKTPQALISDTGTQFKVRFEAGRTRASVRQGSIVVKTPVAEHRVDAADAKPATVVISPGSTVQPLAEESDWTWIYAVARPFKTEGSTVFHLLRWSTNESGRTLVFADDNVGVAARNARFDKSFTVDARDPDSAVVDALATTRFQARRQNDGSLLVSLRGS